MDNKTGQLQDNLLINSSQYDIERHATVVGQPISTLVKPETGYKFVPPVGTVP